MNLKAQIESDAKIALKARQTERVGVLRLILAAIKQVEIDEKKDLTETDLVTVLQKMVKQRRESIKQFEKAGRTDLSRIEEKEIEVVEHYLPNMLADAEIKVIIENVKAQINATSIKDMGIMMAELKKQLGGKADMAAVSLLVKQHLTG